MKIILVKDSEEFDSYDMEPIILFAPDLLIYNYHRESYEGWGNIIMKKGLVWYHHAFSHCSCYGPTQYFDDKDEWKTIKELKENASESLMDDLKPLLDLIEKHWLLSDNIR